MAPDLAWTIGAELALAGAVIVVTLVCGLVALIRGPR